MPARLIKIKTYAVDHVEKGMPEWGEDMPIPNDGLWCKYEDVKELIGKLINVLSEEIVM